MNIANNVGTPIPTVLTEGVIRRCNRERKSLFEGGDASDLPPADNSIDGRTEVGSKSLTLPDGKFVDIADYEAVWNVCAIDGFFGGEVVVVANTGWSVRSWPSRCCPRRCR